MGILRELASFALTAGQEGQSQGSLQHSQHAAGAAYPRRDPYRGYSNGRSCQQAFSWYQTSARCSGGDHRDSERRYYDYQDEDRMQFSSYRGEELDLHNRRSPQQQRHRVPKTAPDYVKPTSKVIAQASGAHQDDDVDIAPPDYEASQKEARLEARQHRYDTEIRHTTTSVGEDTIRPSMSVSQRSRIPNQSLVELSLPFAIPQTSPGTGVPFLRAYSSALSYSGIDCDQFITFVDTLNSTIVPNPEMQLASSAAGLAGWLM